MVKNSKDCPFCKLIASGNVLEYDETGVYYFEPLNPVVRGHKLFVPKEHYPNAAYHPAITGLVVSQALKWAGSHLYDFNLIINSGEHASQTVPHMHVHIVPREEGDGLKLPWTNQGVDLEQAVYESFYDIPNDHNVTEKAVRENAAVIANELKKKGLL